jgi:hypothetical protein
VRVFPLVFGRDSFDGVPVLGDLAVLQTEQVVERRLISGEGARRNQEDPVTLPVNKSDLLKDLAFCRSLGVRVGFECFTQVGDAIG